MKPGIKHLSILPALVACLSWLLAGHMIAQTFTTMHSFSASESVAPQSRLILSGDTLYGTTFGWSSFDAGAVFKMNTDGTAFTILHGFAFTGLDGVAPPAGLVLSGNTLYGTTAKGGVSNSGTIFAVNTDGSGFPTLYAFTGGADGANPQA